MPRLAAALAVLLAALPLSAQVRVTGSLGTTVNAPAVILGGSAALAPLGMTTPLSPATLVPALSAPTLTPLIAPPVALSALSVDLSAAAKPVLPNGVPEAARQKFEAATPADGWAKRFNFEPGSNLFDGSRVLTDETGTVFTAVPKEQGKVRVHLVERAPLVTPKAVRGTEGLTGKPLLDALNAITARGHQAKGYSETSDYMFSTADQVVINGVKGVVDAYSGIFVPGTSKEGGDYPERGDQNGDGHSDRTGMNVEHTWPQSLFNKALPERSDIHHLMATFMHPNSVRGHMPFGKVTGKTDYDNKAGAKRGYDSAGNYIFEPPDAVKGVVARKQLYFYARYKNSRMFGRTSIVYWNQQIELFLKWNREYPPDALEMRRNDLAERWQGNRNPFIDDHLLADRVGAAALRAGIPARGADSAGFRSSSRRRSSRR